MPIGRGTISGSGYIVDDPSMKLRYDVETADANNKIQFVLRATDNITWWKSLDVFEDVRGSWIHSTRIETKNADREAQVDYFDTEIKDMFKLEFWKGGVGGFGAYVTALKMDSYANLGQKIIFTWERDWV